MRHREQLGKKGRLEELTGGGEGDGLALFGGARTPEKLHWCYYGGVFWRGDPVAVEGRPGTSKVHDPPASASTARRYLLMPPVSPKLQSGTMITRTRCHCMVFGATTSIQNPRAFAIRMTTTRYDFAFI